MAEKSSALGSFQKVLAPEWTTCEGGECLWKKGIQYTMILMIGAPRQGPLIFGNTHCGDGKGASDVTCFEVQGTVVFGARLEVQP